MKTILTRSYDDPIDTLILKYTLIALGVSEEELTGVYDTEDIEKKYDIKILDFRDFYTNDQKGKVIMENAIKHLRDYHEPDRETWTCATVETWRLRQMIFGTIPAGELVPCPKHPANLIAKGKVCDAFS